MRPDFFNLSLMYGFNNNNFQCSVLQIRNDNQNVFFYKLDYTSQQADCLLLKVLFNPNLKSQVCFDGETRIDRSDLKLTDFPVIIEICVVQLSDL